MKLKRWWTRIFFPGAKITEDAPTEQAAEAMNYKASYEAANQTLKEVRDQHAKEMADIRSELKAVTDAKHTIDESYQEMVDSEGDLRNQVAKLQNENKGLKAVKDSFSQTDHKQRATISAQDKTITELEALLEQRRHTDVECTVKQGRKERWHYTMRDPDGNWVACSQGRGAATKEDLMRRIEVIHGPISIKFKEEGISE